MENTTEKLLPWKLKETFYFEELLADLKEAGFLTDLVERAYRWAEKAHVGQYRKSGESFMSHPISVARILASFGLDEVTIAAALLHDVVEDTSVTLQDVADEFGSEVALITDGVTKLDKMSFNSEKEASAASMRKMMVAAAKDIRVLFIKLADRLHNMKTLGALNRTRREDIATETLRVYAPLANRLGMQGLASQLEDLAFATLHSKWYGEIDRMVEARTPEREIYLTQVGSQVEERLGSEGIEARVIVRPKHLWSIYKKIASGKDFEDIYDLTGLRVIVNSVSDCYSAMGHIHSMWKFLPGRFKDHIAIPKFNLYQSLHTTVMGPAGILIEIQIRTPDMDDRAERGIAAHWAYKESTDPNLAWLDRIMDWVEDTSTPAESIDTLHDELDQDEVFVFSPKGDLVSLPLGSTPVDFAYAVHSDVGNTARGVKINGNPTPLSTRLSSGDSVQIIRSHEPDAGPLREWLEYAVSRRARNKIRSWFAKGAEQNDEPSANQDPEVDDIKPKSTSQDCGILVDGQDDIWVRLADCCKPTRADEILGFVTKGKGVSIHISDCENVTFLSKKEPNRFIQVEWEEPQKNIELVALEARALDRSGLLRDILSALPPQVFIESVDSSRDEQGVASIKFELELGDRSQVELIVKNIRRIDSVYDVFVLDK